MYSTNSTIFQDSLKTSDCFDTVCGILVEQHTQRKSTPITKRNSYGRANLRLYIDL
jgi:hypothetical protein